MKKSIKELRAELGRELFSDPKFNGTPEEFRNLEVDKQIALTNAMKEHIRKNPDDFTDNQKKVADSPDISKTEKYKAGDAIDSFSEEFGEQVKETVKKTGFNLNKLYILAAVVSVAVGATQLVKLFPPAKK